LRFRHLLEKHKLAPQILAVVNELLGAKGLMLRAGTVVDATLIAAPPSTKNASGERDPDMHQSKKGNQWHFGLKAHIGVDAESGLVHTVRSTAGNVNDVVEANDLLHGDESDAFGDAGYQGVAKRTDANAEVNWHVAMRPGRLRALDLSRPLSALKDQGQHPGQGRAPVSGHQVPVRLPQGALSRAEEERGADRHAVRAVQSVDGAAQFAEGAGMSASAMRPTGLGEANRPARWAESARYSDVFSLNRYSTRLEFEMACS